MLDNIVTRISVPTGDILITAGERGYLECLSLGDYGKAVNLNQHQRVVHTDLLPLVEKWVCTISTQYGCSMGCQFCDVPKAGSGINASFADMQQEILGVLSLHPEVQSTSRFNVHFTRMGEPTFNHNVLSVALWLRNHLPNFNVHPVVSTMMPKNNDRLYGFIKYWMDIKNVLYDGEAGLQLSINSTDEDEREKMFNGNADPLLIIGKKLRDIEVVGRKITLNFAVAQWQINPLVLLRHFDPDKFIVKLTPMHKTTEAVHNGIQTRGDYTEHYPYQSYEESLKVAGYDVLVFIASKEEDESRITCGNAILSQPLAFRGS
jgi:23S rRNA (adenine2503-C2)-methyltransferase